MLILLACHIITLNAFLIKNQVYLKTTEVFKIVRIYDISLYYLVLKVNTAMYLVTHEVPVITLYKSVQNGDRLILRQSRTADAWNPVRVRVWACCHVCCRRIVMEPLILRGLKGGDHRDITQQTTHPRLLSGKIFSTRLTGVKSAFPFLCIEILLNLIGISKSSSK